MKLTKVPETGIQFLRCRIKMVLTRAFTVHSVTESPIFVIATRRSGSTLLMEMLCSQEGVSYVDQPLDLWRYNPQRHRLPVPPGNKFVSLDSADETALWATLSRLARGKDVFNSQWNPLHPSFSPVVHQLVFKILNANPLIEWLSQKTDGKVVYLVRHPVPTALSIMKRGWECTADTYLHNPEFRNRVGKERCSQARRILQRGTALQRYVLDWCLENHLPLTAFPTQSWLTVTYEEILLRPQRMAQMICNELNLSNWQRMAASISHPTRTAFPESRRAIENTSPRHLVSRWQPKLTRANLREIGAVLDIFGLYVYSPYDVFPAGELCHFGVLSAGRREGSCRPDSNPGSLRSRS